MTMELDETDLDEVENTDLFKNIKNANDQNKGVSKQQNMIDEGEKVEQYDKTLELSDIDENEEDNNLFKTSDKKNNQKEDDFEKTLEIKSDNEDEDNNQLFVNPSKDKQNNNNNNNNNNQNKQNNKNNENNQQQNEYDKTLELSSDDGKEEEERQLFNQNDSKKRTTQASNDYDKTLELSDRNSDEENQELFNKQKIGQNHKVSEKSNTNSSKTNQNQDFEKTLELSDKSSDEEDKNLFTVSSNNAKKSQANECFEKTLELSDKDSNDEDLFKNNNKSKNMAMECEKTLEVSDKEDEEQNNLFKISQDQQQPVSASLSATISDKQKRMNMIKNNNLLKNLQVQSSSLAQESKEKRKTVVMSDENEKTPDLSEEEKQNTSNQQKSRSRKVSEGDNNKRGNQYNQSPSNNSNKMIDESSKSYMHHEQNNITKEMLQDTLVDEDSFHEDSCFMRDDSNSQTIHNKHSQKHNQIIQLAATLIDSPSQSQSQIFETNHNSQIKSHNNNNNNNNNNLAIPPLLGQTLVDDETNSAKSNSLNNSQQKIHLKKLKSPITLSPTFLDEEVNMSILSLQNSQNKRAQNSRPSSNNSVELGATLIDASDSKSRNLSPTLINSPESQKHHDHQVLQNTIIDSPQSQHSQQGDQNQGDYQLMKKIQQQEEELKRLREQLLNQKQGSAVQQKKQTQHQGQAQQQKDGSKQQVRFQNEGKSESKESENNLNEMNYVINVLPSLSEIQSDKEQSKKQKNINLDKVNQFDDLFGNDDEEDELKRQTSKPSNPKGENSKSGNEGSSKNEDSNSGAENKEIILGMKQDSSNQQRNFGMLFNKKFPIRTLTMSDVKKNISTPVASSTMPVSIDESDEYNKQSNKQQVSSTAHQRPLFQSSDVPSSDECAQSKKVQRLSDIYRNKREKANSMKEENEIVGSSEELGEDPKKKIKVQSSWTALLKQRTSKIQDENSRNSTKSEVSVSQEQNSQPNRQTRQSAGMVAEDVDGNLIKESLKIAVSGFKLGPQQKKGIKALKCTFIEDNEDFDVLVVSEAKRTVKLLLALMKRKPIVSEQWLNDCIKKNQLIQTFSDYPPQSDTFKERFNQELSHLIKKRRSIGQENTIFEDCTFYVTKSVNDPSEEELQSLIEAGGGAIRKTLPNKQMKKSPNNNMIVVLGKSDLSIYKTVSKLKNVICIPVDTILTSAQNSEFEYESNAIDSPDFFKA